MATCSSWSMTGFCRATRCCHHKLGLTGRAAPSMESRCYSGNFPSRLTSTLSAGPKYSLGRAKRYFLLFPLNCPFHDWRELYFFLLFSLFSLRFWKNFDEKKLMSWPLRSKSCGAVSSPETSGKRWKRLRWSSPAVGSVGKTGLTLMKSSRGVTSNGPPSPYRGRSDRGV